MRGVWILPERMKWKKGTDGGGVGREGKKRQDRCSRVLCWSTNQAHRRGDSRERLHFFPAVLEKREKIKANERAR